MRILVLAPAPDVRQLLVDLLTEAGHDAEALAEGRRGLERALQPDVELVLLDQALADLDGLSLCERLRRQRPALPILVITAEDDVAERVRALQAGADDCLPPMFAPSQMVARVGALERRARLAPRDADLIQVDGAVLVLSPGSVVRGGRATELTAREVGILRWLHRHRGRAVSRGELLEQVWGLSPDLLTRTVDMTIANLRRKIERDPQAPRIILSVKGVGYRFSEG